MGLSYMFVSFLDKLIHINIIRFGLKEFLRFKNMFIKLRGVDI